MGYHALCRDTLFQTLLRSPHALLTGLIVSVMTFWKTMLYMIQYFDICAGGHRMEHVDTQTMMMYFVLPSGTWLVFPFIMILYYSKKLSLLLSQKSQSKRD